MDWAGLWLHMDGLVHVIGRYLPSGDGGRRMMHSECGREMAGVLDEENYRFLSSNTTQPWPTCVACWHESNFGSYAPR
jgi:hypothetical protein